MNNKNTPRIPNEIKHGWRRDKERSLGTWICILCNTWTANFRLYKDDICPKKDRRKNKVDRRNQNA